MILSKSHLAIGLCLCLFGYGLGRLTPVREPMKVQEDALKPIHLARGTPFRSAHVDGLGAGGLSSSLSPAPDDGPGADAFKEHLRLENLREQGEFVLELEDPLRRKLYEDLWNSSGNKVRDGGQWQARAEILSSFGLSSNQVAQFDRHLVQLARASSQLETGLSQYRHAKSEYFSRVRAGLSDEQFEAYLDFEKGLCGKRDLEAFSEHLSRNVVTPDETTLPAFIDLLKATDATTFESWTGPLDPMPDPAIGPENVIAKLRNEISRIKAGRDRIVSMAVEQVMPAEFVIQLEDYYASRVRIIEANIAGVQQWMASTSGGQLIGAGLQESRKDPAH